MGIQTLLNIQTMKTIIILTVLVLCGSLANACVCLCSDKECLEKHNLKSCKNRGYDRVIDASTVETLASHVCNTDGEEGLSWAEVEDCLEHFCHLLPEIACPTKEEFEFFDMDGNGILTWSEWQLANPTVHV